MRHRVPRVDDEVHDDLLDLAAIHARVLEIGRQGHAHIDVLPDEPGQHLAEAAHDVVEALHGGLENLLPAEGQELAGEPGRPLRRFLHFLEPGPEPVLGRHLAEGQLRLRRDHREEIVEVMGHAASKATDGVHLLGLSELLFHLGVGLLHALPLGLAPMALGHVLERDHHAGDHVALHDGGAPPGHRQTPTPHASEPAVRRAAGLAITKGRQDRWGILRRGGAVGPVHGHRRAGSPSHLPARTGAEHRRRRLVHEHDPPVGVDAEDALSRRLQDQAGAGQRLLVEPPGEHAAHAREEDEARVDGRPRPGRGERGRVIVDVHRPQHAHQAVVRSDVADGEEERQPILEQGEEDQHHEEVEVPFDVAAREVHEDRGGAHEADCDRARLHRAAGARECRHRRAHGHHHAFPQSDEARLQAVAEHHRPRHHDRNGMQPGQADEEPAALPPQGIGKRTARREGAPQSLDDCRDAYCRDPRLHAYVPSGDPAIRVPWAAGSFEEKQHDAGTGRSRASSRGDEP